MSVIVRIPSPLRKLTNDLSEVTCESRNVREIIEELEKKYPGIKERLLDENGEIRRFINIYVGEEDIRFLNGLDSEIAEEQEVSIVPAIAGG